MSHSHRSERKWYSRKIRRIVTFSVASIMLFACAIELARSKSQAKNPTQQISFPRREMAAGTQALRSGAPDQPMDSDEFWNDATALSLRDLSGVGDQATNYRLVELNGSVLRQALANAPLEFKEDAKRKTVIISLPVPDGRLWRFRIEESPIMSPNLAAKFPEIKTYSGQGIDDPSATLRFSWDPTGLKAFVLSPQGSFNVFPYLEKNDRYYLSIFTRDVIATPFECLMPGAGKPEKVGKEQIGAPYVSAPDFVISGSTLREYRLSFSVTQQFYEHFGGLGISPQNDSAVVAALTAFVNNLNLIYVTEISSRFRFHSWVADRPGLCGPGFNCFPSNQDPESMQVANQHVLDNIFPGANAYDIGMVLGYSNNSPGGIASFGSGGNTGIGGACEGGFKGKAAILVTGPAGNYWSSVVVAHELGHMFGAKHTFSSFSGPCGEQLDAMMEPGSGSTIMSYNPICPPDNLYTGNPSGASDPYFLIHSLLRIANHKSTYFSCGQTFSTGNAPPVLIDGGANATIPAYTPFTLTAAASDPDGDAITYNWEEWDPGATLYRSYLPNSIPSRTFPDLYFVLNYGSVPPASIGGFLTGEALPSTTRTLNFTVTVRDNRTIGGATTARDQLLQVNVRGDAGPFFITRPNSPLSLLGGSPTSVTWNVANTNLAPISTANVRILLSTDGGVTFATVLAASTPNDGSEMLTVPNVQTSTARVKVEAVGNIYFDISDTNFTINQVATPTAHRKTIGVFRPSNGIIYLKNANTGGVADLNFVYGVAGDKPIAGDWDGNGVDTLGIYRNGTFYLRNSNTTGAANIVFSFGASGDQPLAGDWNGDGTDTIGVYRPSTGVFFLRNSNSAGPADVSFVLGNPGDVGIAGDWNVDGVTTTGVFRPSNGIIYLKNANSSGFADIYLVYGNAGDLPVAGDWDGDGISSVGIYRNGVFYLRNLNTQGFADLVFAMGNNGDVPIAGDWDGLP